MFRTFKHITPASRIIYGPDSLTYLDSELKHAGGSRVLIFCDPFVKEDKEMIGAVLSCVGDRCVGIFSDIVPRSPIENVMEGVKKIRETQADSLIVIGGGSTTVTARAANDIAAENKDPHEMCTHEDADGKTVTPKLMAPKLPVIAIPTTPTTATVKAGAAILDTGSNTLLPLFDPKNRPHSVFIHPAFAKTAPYSLILNAGFSTMACAFDGLMSKDREPVSDALLMQALRMLFAHLDDPDTLSDEKSRCEMILAAALCGMGSDFTGFGISVVLGHAVCAHHAVRDGFVNAIAIPQAIAFNKGYGDGIDRIAAALNISPVKEKRGEDAVLAAYQNMKKKHDMPESLSEMGVPESSIPAIVDSALSDWYLHFNPRAVNKEEMTKIVHKIF